MRGGELPAIYYSFIYKYEEGNGHAVSTTWFQRTRSALYRRHWRDRTQAWEFPPTPVFGFFHFGSCANLTPPNIIDPIGVSFVCAFVCSDQLRFVMFS